MTQPSATAVPALVLSRVYDASPGQVYAAWTQPEKLAKVLGAACSHVDDVTVDPRVGGAYSLVMVKENGERLPVRGTYRDVQPGRRLSMTWTWEEDDPADEQETLLTLDFHDRDGKTELVLTHERFANADSREKHSYGWTAILDELTAAL